MHPGTGAGHAGVGVLRVLQASAAPGFRAGRGPNQMPRVVEHGGPLPETMIQCSKCRSVMAYTATDVWKIYTDKFISCPVCHRSVRILCSKGYIAVLPSS